MAFKRIFIFLLISLFCFLALETFQRIRRYNATKEISLLLYPFKKPKEIIEINVKAQGLFRHPFNIQEKAKGANILFIGGSSTYGVYNDDFHTFIYLLQGKINEISCLNAGKCAISANEYLDLLIKCCREYCVPDMVVFYTGYNDLFYKHFDKTQGRSFKPYAILEKYSLLLIDIRMKYIQYAQLKKQRDPAYRLKFVKEFESDMEESIKFAKSKNIKVVLIPEVVMAEKFSLSPTRDYRWYKEIYQEVPGTLKKLALKYNSYFLDPSPDLSINWEDNFIDPVHLTDKGNEVLSAYLLKNIPWQRLKQKVEIAQNSSIIN